MRTILFICALLTVFGTGCGGCVDDDKGHSTNQNQQTTPVQLTPRRNSLMGRVSTDAGPVDTDQ